MAVFLKAGAARIAGPPSALGTFFGGPRPPGFAAAPTRPGRKIGSGVVPAFTGIFRQNGAAIAVSQINTIATNIHRGGG